MLARASYLSVPRRTHYLLRRSPLCQRSQGCKVVRTPLISVRASAGQRAAAGVKQQVASDSLKSTEQMSAAEGCLRFINHAWTQFHAVGESYADLLAVRKLQLCPYIHEIRAIDWWSKVCSLNCSFTCRGSKQAIVCYWLPENI